MKKQPLPLTYTNILNYLMLGRESAIKSTSIQRFLRDECGVKVSNPVLRSMMKDMIEYYGLAIGATPRRPAGYYIIQTESELRENICSLMSRVRSILGRVNALDKNFHSKPIEQLKLWKDDE
jgi:hypothetical protein